jgi:hypothetical protein
MKLHREWRIDFSVSRGSSTSRQSRVISQSVLKNNGNSAWAIVDYLRSRNPGAQIELNACEEI